MPRSSLRGPAYRPLLHGCRDDGTARVDRRLLARAALTALPAGVLSDRWAAWALGADVLRRSDDVVELVRPEDDRASRRPQVRCRVAELQERDVVTTDDGLRTTSPLRTACDVARMKDLVEAVVVLDALLALGLGWTTTQALAELDRWRGGRGVARARWALGLVRGRVESPMETRLRLLLVLAGLPEPQVQVQVHAWGHLVARVDLGYVEHRIALEYDGGVHDVEAVATDDARRQRALEAAGWTVLRFRKEDLQSESWLVVVRVQEALRQAEARV